MQNRKLYSHTACARSSDPTWHGWLKTQVNFSTLVAFSNNSWLLTIRNVPVFCVLQRCLVLLCLICARSIPRILCQNILYTRALTLRKKYPPAPLPSSPQILQPDWSIELYTYSIYRCLDCADSIKGAARSVAHFSSHPCIVQLATPLREEEKQHESLHRNCCHLSGLCPARDGLPTCNWVWATALECLPTSNWVWATALECLPCWRSGWISWLWSKNHYSRPLM